MARQDMVLWKDHLQFPAGTLDQCKPIDLSPMSVNVTSCDVGSYSVEMGLFSSGWHIL